MRCIHLAQLSLVLTKSAIHDDVVFFNGCDKRLNRSPPSNSSNLSQNMLNTEGMFGHCASYLNDPSYPAHPGTVSPPTTIKRIPHDHRSQRALQQTQLFSRNKLDLDTLDRLLLLLFTFHLLMLWILSVVQRVAKDCNRAGRVVARLPPAARRPWRRQHAPSADHVRAHLVEKVLPYQRVGILAQSIPAQKLCRDGVR